MELSHSLSTLTYRRTHRVRGPRPYSWISSSSSSDSSSNEYRDVWPWTLASSNLSRVSTLCSSTSSQSSDSSTPSSHPVHTLNALIEYDDKPYYHHGRRRRPAGPRPPRDGSCFDLRKPGLWINTSPPAAPQFQRELPPITPTLTPVPSADMLQPPRVPPFTIHSPTNFLLDWDIIFEILGCSEAPQESAKDDF